MATPAFILELPIQDGDDVSRFLKPKFSFGTQVYNATLDTALGRLQKLRESKEWRDAYSAFLASCANENEHDQSVLFRAWTRAEPLLRDAGLCCDFNPATDGDLSKSTKEPAFAACFRQSGMHLETFRKSGDSRSYPKRRGRKSEGLERPEKPLGIEGILSL